LEFHFEQHIIPGYTWMIPLGNGHLNIGTGTYTTRTRRGEIDLKAVVERFIAEHPINPGRLANIEPIGPIKGHPLHTNLGNTQTHTDGLMVVGDAAGLISPFTGEGIASALRSGERAAETATAAFERGDLSADALAGYSRAILTRYHGDQNAARFLRSVLRYPPLLNRAFRNMIAKPALGKLFTMIYLDEKSPRGLMRPANLLRLVL
jgi:flavin-dependent dehydrogenase